MSERDGAVLAALGEHVTPTPRVTVLDNRCAPFWYSFDYLRRRCGSGGRFSVVVRPQELCNLENRARKRVDEFVRQNANLTFSVH